MGEILSQKKENCQNCKESQATHEYTWAIGHFFVCEKCRDMLASNTTKDAIKSRTGNMPKEASEDFLNRISKVYG